jgi:ribosomal protein S18 acetylase RimI-like enzyme
MPAIHTRTATLADLDLLAPLFDAYRQFYQQASDPARARRFIEARLRQGDSVVVLAFGAQGQAVGFCQLYPSFCSIEAQPIYTLSDLYVEPAARRCGAGSALLRAARAQAAAHGKVRLELTTAHTNTAAQAAYTALGWVRDEVFRTYTLQVAPS